MNIKKYDRRITVIIGPKDFGKNYALNQWNKKTKKKTGK